MGLRVSLDGIILENTPMGWDEAKIDTKRDNTIKGLFTNYATDLEFWGDGFDYIDTKMEEDYCKVIDVLIETDDCDSGVFITEFEGKIQMPQISRYNVDERTIRTRILDASFSSQIDNNKSIKAFVDVGISKNDVSIDAVTPVDIQVFNPNDDFFFHITTPRKMYRVYDCFRFIIDYMTDGQVGFYSDYIKDNFNDWFLCNGQELRLGGGGGLQLEVSFKQLFQEIDKKTNLSFALEPSTDPYDNGYRVRIEETDFFEQEDSILSLSNVEGILMSFNKDELYSHITIGSSKFDDDVVLSYPPLNLKAFKEENYTIQGECNIDKELNLVSKFIIDTNVIEDVVVNFEKKYSKEIFLIVTDGAKAIKYKEYDEAVAEGTDTAGTAFKLTDSTATFITTAAVTVGDMVVNIDTGATANLNAIDSETVLSLDTDIFNSGDNYQVRDKPFNYNDPLTNIRVVGRFIGGLPNSVIKHLSVAATSKIPCRGNI